MLPICPSDDDNSSSPDEDEADEPSVNDPTDGNDAAVSEKSNFSFDLFGDARPASPILS